MRSQKLYQIREQVIETLRNLKREVKCKVYLFGSYARGDHLLDSDVDILVVSESFKGLPQAERIAQIRLKLPGDMPFDIIALTPEEHQKLKDRAFYKEISKHWIEI